ncbi:MAG TPA: DUF1656 domain-containing protein [Stenotrophomonas sp.]|jgi:hypothetical protein
MPREIAFAGTLLPGLMVLFLAMVGVFWAADAVAGRYHLYRYVWHPALFRIAIFVLLFGSAALLLL